MDEHTRRAYLALKLAPGVLAEEHRLHGYVCNAALEDVVAAELEPREQVEYLRLAAAARREPRDVEAHARMLAGRSGVPGVDPALTGARGMYDKFRERNGKAHPFEQEHLAQIANASTPRGRSAPVAVARAVKHLERPVEVRRAPVDLVAENEREISKLERAHGITAQGTHRDRVAVLERVLAGVDARAATRATMDAVMGITASTHTGVTDDGVKLTLGASMNIDGTPRRETVAPDLGRVFTEAGGPAPTPAPSGGLSPAQLRVMGLGTENDVGDFGLPMHRKSPAPLTPAQRRMIGGGA